MAACRGPPASMDGQLLWLGGCCDGRVEGVGEHDGEVR
eukprot:CAMPEP_0177794334 /NCGR_PEP_ID=MMETSP0491_2-20121128/25588_1 /TAXON_ID=63592 /ORGANISM="Tetraselmis chuii, Strain PLY429" /LENGTH=37 /DNA_ID= /DNA_START= /DNA_END= /DNA_ORIENTATION=